MADINQDHHPHIGEDDKIQSNQESAHVNHESGQEEESNVKQHMHNLVVDIVEVTEYNKMYLFNIEFSARILVKQRLKSRKSLW